MVLMVELSTPLASLLIKQNWEKWLLCQRVVLLPRGTSTGWRNELMRRKLMRFNSGKEAHEVQ